MDKRKFIDIMSNYGQREFLEYFIAAEDAVQGSILSQADMLDFDMIRAALNGEGGTERGRITPISTMTRGEIDNHMDSYYSLGLDAIKNGKIGTVLLAGGMGTRLGFDGPKGMYDIGETHHMYIFQRIIENLMDVVKVAGRYIHLFVMTSYSNDEATRAFFREMNWFGYDPDYITFFVQDMAPCLDEKGRLLLESADAIAMSPNGNGGFYSSMITNGVDIVMKRAGIEYLNVFAVDNVLQKIADPVFIGAVISGRYASGAKVVAKSEPTERVGVICLEDGAPSVVEYYELTEEMMNARDNKGNYAYNYGVILNYLFKTDGIDRIVRRELPVHLVKKKVPYYDGTGTVQPDEPNAYKLETLVLDMVHLTGDCLSFEVEREKEFAPIKNASGIDSVETAKDLLRKNGYIL